MAGDLTVGQLRVILEADSSKFAAAMKNANADSKKLADSLKKELEPSTRGVNAAFKDFLGVNTIKRAQEMAEAVKRLGGATKLTEADQRKLNAAVSDALAHYKAMGVQAPKNLTAIRDATQGATSSIANIGTGLKSMAGLMGVTFSAAAVVGFGKHVVSVASDINTMAKRLDVSAEFAQRLKHSLDQTGSSMEAGEKAIAEMNKSLAAVATSDKKIAELNKHLKGTGLSVQDLLNMNPEQRFTALANAAGKVGDDLQRTALMQEFFGKSAIELMPLVAAGYDKVAKGAAVMSDETIKALADAQDAWQALYDKITVITGNAIGFILNASQRQKDAAADLAFGMDEVAKKALATSRAMLNGTTFAEEYAKVIKELTKNYKDVDLPLQKTTKRTMELTDAQKEAAKQAEAYRKKIQEAAKALTGEKVRQDVKELADILKAAGDVTKLSGRELVIFAQQLDLVQQRGGKLTPELQAVRDKFMFFRDMVHSTRIQLELLNKTPAFAQFNRDAEIGRRKDFFGNMGPLAMPGPVVSLQNQINRNQVFATKQTQDWASALDEVVNSFEQLANISGGAMSNVSRSVGTAIGLAGQLSKAFKAVQSGLPGGADGTNWVSVAAGMASAVTAVASIVMEIANALEESEPLKAMRLVGERWGEQISKGLAERISVESDAVHQFGFGADATTGGRSLREIDELLNLADIIEDTGGLAEDNLAKWSAGAQELFDVIAMGGRVGERAMGELNEVAGLFFAQAEESGGVWGEELQAIIAKARETGIELQAVNDAIKGQLALGGQAASGLAGGFGQEIRQTKTKKTTDAMKVFDEQVKAAKGNAKAIEEIEARRAAFIKGINAQIVADSQESYDRISRLALAAFNAFTDNGGSAVDAAKALAPAIAELESAATEFGFAGNAAFNELKKWGTLVQENEGLLNQLGALEQLAASLGNTGSLTVEAFQDIQDEAQGIFLKLRSAGFTEEQALKQMEPILKNIIKLHQDSGKEIDAETLALINQSKQYGLLQDEGLDTNNILMQGLAALIEALGGEVPAAWKDMLQKAKDAAQALEDEFNSIEVDPVHVPIVYDIDDPPFPQGPNEGGGPAPEFAGGGVGDFGAGTWAKLHGKEWIFRDNDFQELMRAFSTQPSLPSMSMASALSGIAGEIRSAADAPIYLMADSRVLGEVSARSDSGAASRFGLMRS